MHLVLLSYLMYDSHSSYRLTRWLCHQHLQVNGYHDMPCNVHLNPCHTLPADFELRFRHERRGCFVVATAAAEDKDWDGGVDDVRLCIE